MHFFYLPDLDLKHPSLPEEESKHATKVLRMQEGEKLTVTDGKGLHALAVIAQLDKKHCALKIVSSKHLEKPSPSVNLAIAPTKNSDRLEWLVEKATELGIDNIFLIQCEHSERKTQKTDRLEKIAVAALKQSQQCWIPKIHEIESFKSIVIADIPGQKLIAHCMDSPKRSIVESYIPGSDVTIFIGPEGDFSETEVKLASAHGFQPVSLGNNRLRTETAALFALSAVLVKNME